MEPAPLRKYWCAYYKCGCEERSPVYTKFPSRCTEHEEPITKEIAVTEYGDPDKQDDKNGFN